MILFGLLFLVLIFFGWIRLLVLLFLCFLVEGLGCFLVGGLVLFVVGFGVVDDGVGGGVVFFGVDGLLRRIEICWIVIELEMIGVDGCGVVGVLII